MSSSVQFAGRGIFYEKHTTWRSVSLTTRFWLAGDIAGIQALVQSCNLVWNICLDIQFDCTATKGCIVTRDPVKQSGPSASLCCDILCFITDRLTELQVGRRSLKTSRGLHFILLISVALSFLGPVVLVCHCPVSFSRICA